MHTETLDPEHQRVRRVYRVFCVLILLYKVQLVSCRQLFLDTCFGMFIKT